MDSKAVRKKKDRMISSLASLLHCFVISQRSSARKGSVDNVGEMHEKKTTTDKSLE